MSTAHAHKRAALIPAAVGEDAAMLVAADSGRNQAFETLIGRYQARLLRIAMQFTRNREDAEDITQQSFQKAFVHLQQFEGSSLFSTWLTRIVINEALMWLRRRRTSREVPIEESSTGRETVLSLDRSDPGPSPEDSYLQRERKRILSRAINELTPTQRVAIERRELDELSTKETAQALGLSIQAVKTRVFRARKKLRAILKLYFESARTHRNQPLRPSDESKGVSRQSLVSGACDWRRRGSRMPTGRAVKCAVPESSS